MLVDDLAVAEGDDRGDAANAVFAGAAGRFVDVVLGDDGAAVEGLRGLFKARGEHAAGAAPGRPEVDEDGLAGLNDFDLNMLGIGDLDFSINDDIWRKEDILDDSLSAIDEATKEGKENKDINRSNNFYEDSKENQIVRHNEVQKIKDRISNQNSFEKDNGMLSYVVLSFNSPTERVNFMKMFGYGFEERYIDGKEFMDRIEFGVE